MGLEPTTSCLQSRCSSQLSYAPECFHRKPAGAGSHPGGCLTSHLGCDPVQRSEMFHVGIVVPDLAAAQKELGALLGLVWGPVVSLSLAVRLGDGSDVEYPNTICYSTEPPYLELIQEVKGSPWECNAHSNLHHIGFFTEDLQASSMELGQAGCPLQVCGRQEGAAPTSFAYHDGDARVRIELVDAQLRTSMMEWLCTPASGDESVR